MTDALSQHADGATAQQTIYQIEKGVGRETRYAVQIAQALGVNAEWQNAHRLAGASATLREIWDAYEAITRAPPADTVQMLIASFESSPAWEDLADSTRRDYRICAESIVKAETKAGVLVGTTRLSDWTPGAVRSYVEKRAERSRSRANHELRYLRRLFAWAFERDLMASNPARGVKSLKESARQRYVSDHEYADFLAHAGPRHPYLIPVAELAYLCRLRISEVCDLRREDIREDGLFAARRKGSKDALTGWTPRLRIAIDCALTLHGQMLKATSSRPVATAP